MLEVNQIDKGQGIIYKRAHTENQSDSQQQIASEQNACLSNKIEKNIVHKSRYSPSDSS